MLLETCKRVKSQSYYMLLIRYRENRRQSEPIVEYMFNIQHFQLHLNTNQAAEKANTTNLPPAAGKHWFTDHLCFTSRSLSVKPPITQQPSLWANYRLSARRTLRLAAGGTVSSDKTAGERHC